MHVELTLNDVTEDGHSVTSLCFLQDKGLFDSRLIFPVDIKWKVCVIDQSNRGSDLTYYVRCNNVSRMTDADQGSRTKQTVVDLYEIPDYIRGGVVHFCIKLDSVTYP